VDATTILTAAIAGLAGIGGGWLSMRQQVATMREQLRAERDRARETRSDEKLDRRLDAYLSFLNVERRLRTLLASKRSFSQAEYAKWTGEFLPLYHLVVLAGTESVRLLADDLFGLFQQIDNERINLGGERFADALVHAFQHYEVELERTELPLIAAMRRDVGPLPTSTGLAAFSPPTTPPAEVKPEPAHASRVEEIAIVADTTSIAREQLERVVAAIQTQVSRDFAPVWDVDARLLVHEQTADVPDGMWSITVADDIGAEGRLAFQTEDAGGRPYGMVLFSENWPHSVSHICLELLAAPHSDRVASGPSPKPRQGEVQFVVQTCDPCTAPEFGYEIDGVAVCDFCTPAFYNPASGSQTKLDHTGALRVPLSVAPFGYLTWIVPKTKHYWQLLDNGEAKPQYYDLGRFENVPQFVEAIRSAGGVSFFGRAQPPEPSD
jgi:hypothetical protein